MTGQEAYEAEVAAWPLYWNGRPRKTWDQLDGAAKWAWLIQGKPRTTPPYCLRAEHKARPE